MQTSYNEHLTRFSSDGNWIAYVSDETGRNEVYVQPFHPGAKPGSRVTISTNGGSWPRWRRDGKELFYLALDSRLMAVPIRVAPNGETIQPGPPVALFATHTSDFWPVYVVSPDGQRFLLNTEGTNNSPITVILNWKPKS